MNAEEMTKQIDANVKALMVYDDRDRMGLNWKHAVSHHKEFGAWPIHILQATATFMAAGGK